MEDREEIMKQFFADPSVPEEAKQRVRDGKLTPIIEKVPLGDGEDAFVAAMAQLVVRIKREGAPMRIAADIVAVGIQAYTRDNNLGTGPAAWGDLVNRVVDAAELIDAAGETVN